MAKLNVAIADDNEKMIDLLETLIKEDNELELEVNVAPEEDTVWLTQAQMVKLFQSSKANISEHIKNIYDSGELYKEETVRNFRTVRIEGKKEVKRNLDYYNLDMIISVGYRVSLVRMLTLHWRKRLPICCIS